MQNQAQAFVKNIELSIGVDDKANTSDEAFKAFGIQDATGWIVLNPHVPHTELKTVFFVFRYFRCYDFAAWCVFSMWFHLQGESPQIKCVVSTFHMCDSPLSTFLEEGVDMCKKLLEGGAPGRAEHSIGTQKLTQIFPHEYTRQEYLRTIY